MKSYRYIIPEAKRIAGRYQDDAAESAALPAAPPFHGSYGGLLFDPRWKAKRAEILSRDADRCVICKGSQELQVHHRQYQYIEQAKAFRMPWDYADDLLISLCKSCHQRGHAKFKIPILIIR